MDQLALTRLRLYLVTDRTQSNDRPLPAVIEQALQGGVRAVQLRERGLETRALFDLAVTLRALTRRHDALLLVNDRVDVALACDADGVHLPARSFAVTDARRLLGPTRLIGVSTHGVDEVAAAAQGGADFVVFGPIYATPSKLAYGSPLGVDQLAAAVHIAIPVIAIGGITSRNVSEVAARGVAGVAVIRAVLAAENPAHAARELIGTPHL